MSKYPFAASCAGLITQVDLLRNSRKSPVLGYYVLEYRFHPVRRWRFDLAFPVFKVAAEYHGGLFMKRRGGHQSVKGSMNDWEKLNEAQILGWLVLQFGPHETRSGSAMNTIERALKSRIKV